MARLPLLTFILSLTSLLPSTRAYSVLSDASLHSIPSPGDDFDIKDGKLLAPILQPRVPGTPGSDAVLSHLADFFRNQLPEWTVTFQNSTSKTPKTGDQEVPFRNLIVSRSPPGAKPGEVGYLTLVAHFDSLIAPEGFIGAIDSAAPCAFLMHAARSLEGPLTRKWASMGQEGDDLDDDFERHQGVQILFLDGEEAFYQWSDTDSVYGARSLAAEWEGSFHPARSTYKTALSSISLFVLLDLLGAANPRVPSYFKTTHWAYKHMATVEQNLRKSGKLQTRESTWFPETEKKDGARWLGGFIGDDHVPFQQRGVEVLHIIPSPFPEVWHNARGVPDDGEHLDMKSCDDWAIIVTAFAAEWLELEGFMEDGNAEKREPQNQVTSKTEL